MSSLRLALKQSLEDALPHPPPRTKKTSRRSSTGRPRGRPPKRKPGDPPRKRGRPRKHPLPEEEEVKHEEEEEVKHEEEEEEEASHHDDDASSSEAEFSVSQEDDDNTETEHEMQKEEEEEEEHESSEDEEEKRRKRRKLQKKAMKREQNSAANKIQNHWKKKRSPSMDETVEKKKKAQDDDAQEKQKKEENKKKSGKAKTVPPPEPDLVAYQRRLSPKKQRRNMSAGLRVKVRFATKVRKRDGKVATKLKWYGGLVTRVSTGGSKIRIKYDDGTTEVSKFPDNDVIVDEHGNGEHRVPAGRFVPPSQRAAAKAAPAEPEPKVREEEDGEKKPTRTKKLKRSPSKTEREEEQPAAERDPESKPSTPLVKSPRAKPKQLSAKKRAASPRECDESQAASAGDEREEAPQGETEVQAEETKEAATDDSGDVHKESSGTRKKLHVKIRLKGPNKASIVASTSHDSSDNRSAEEEEEHVEDDAKEDDAMEVDESPKVEAQVDKDEGEQETVSPESPQPATAETVENVEEQPEDQIAPKKRAHDEVTVTGSGDEASEEPPQKKRAEEPVAESEAVETEVKEVVQDEPEQTDSMEVVDEGKPPEDEKVSEATDEAAEAESQPERKRKRETEVEKEEAEEEKRSPEHSAPEVAESQTTEPPEAVEEEKSSDTEEASKPDATEAEEDSMQVDSVDKQPTESIAEPADSKSDKANKNDDVASPTEVATESLNNEAETAEANSPRSPVQEDEPSEAKPAPIASIPRFGRRAAQQANERIAARKERIIVDEFAKKKKHRKEKAELKALSPSEQKARCGEDDSGDDDVDGEWVQCDNCSKWRILPSSVETSELPKHWYCEMNVYDPDRSTCDAPEQTIQEILKEKRRRKRRLAKIARLEAAGKIDAETAAAQRLALDNRERKSGRGRARLSTRSPNPLKDAQDSGADVPRSRGRKKRSSPVAAEEEAVQHPESPTADDGSDSQKSNSFKKQSSFGSAGRRSNKSDDGANAEDDAEAEPVPKKRGRGRPPGRPPRNRNKDAGGKDADKGKNGRNGASDPDNQEWVACEKCQKWRRLPSHISADSLPEVWYCSMNTWDPKAASCDAAEDKADPGHQEFGIYGSGVSTASYGNKLSYRNLIFGTGRKQNRLITERTRAAESLFLAPTDPSSDGTSYPKVMYANSSVFMPRLSNAQKAHAQEAEKKISLFELMNHSNLWAELRAASNMAQPDKHGSSMLISSYDRLSDERKQTMKEMVLHAIGSVSLACDEVLLEAQCRQWSNVPQEWAEIRASCTIDMIEGALRDLIADGRIETVPDLAQTVLSSPKYRRVSAASSSAPANSEVRSTRCMKIAKPWKKSRPNMTHEWASA